MGYTILALATPGRGVLGGVMPTTDLLWKDRLGIAITLLVAHVILCTIKLTLWAGHRRHYLTETALMLCLFVLAVVGNLVVVGTFAVLGPTDPIAPNNQN